MRHCCFPKMALEPRCHVEVMSVDKNRVSYFLAILFLFSGGGPREARNLYFSWMGVGVSNALRHLSAYRI